MKIRKTSVTWIILNKTLPSFPIPPTHTLFLHYRHILMRQPNRKTAKIVVLGSTCVDMCWQQIRFLKNTAYGPMTCSLVGNGVNTVCSSIHTINIFLDKKLGFKQAHKLVHLLICACTRKQPHTVFTYLTSDQTIRQSTCKLGNIDLQATVPLESLFEVLDNIQSYLK